MTLSSDALTKVATVKQELNISASTDDTYLEFLIEVASAAIKSYCNRTFYFSEDVSESVAGYGNNLLIVKRPPISLITSITYDGTTVSSDDYEIQDANAGTIYNPGGWYWTAQVVKNIGQDVFPGSEQKLYTIVYDGGWVTTNQTGTRNLPYEIEQACIELVVSKYRNRGRDYRIDSESLLSWSASYKGATDGIPDSVKLILNTYKLTTVL